MNANGFEGTRKSLYSQVDAGWPRWVVAFSQVSRANSAKNQQNRDNCDRAADGRAKQAMWDWRIVNIETPPFSQPFIEVSTARKFASNEELPRRERGSEANRVSLLRIDATAW
jgi:hypothetical protein